MKISTSTETALMILVCVLLDLSAAFNTFYYRASGLKEQLWGSTGNWCLSPLGGTTLPDTCQLVKLQT